MQNGKISENHQLNSTFGRGYGTVPRKGIIWVWPPPRMPVADEGLVRNPRSYKCNNPGGHWNPGSGAMNLTKFEG